MSKITPFLWFDDNAEEAMDFYTTLFSDAKIHSKKNGPNGKMFSGSMEIFGQKLLFMNGGPHYALSPSFSLFIECENQAEVDYYWNGFIENGGTESRCGWLTDKYGLSWQIIPKKLPELLGSNYAEIANFAMQAMLKMNKIIIKDLEK